jgi:ketosteroid isomerase-like protein
MSDEVAVSADNPNQLDPDAGLESEKGQPETVEGKQMEEFFQRLPGNFRWPKPNAEAVAAAVEAIHRMSGSAAAAQDLAAAADSDESGKTCSACGVSMPPGARFCAACGRPNQPVSRNGDAALHPDTHTHPQFTSSSQHHVHHHYHHIVPGLATAASAPSAEFESTPRGRVPGPGGNSTGGRAEAGARQVVQDWAQACNTKHIDDLLELYAADATVIRSSVPPVRSLPAIREFLVSLLEAGLGDVEMESLRLEMLGEIAFDIGRCKMLVPVAMGKRREERGKYLIVLVRQPAGTWKILADCWSSDLAVSAPPPESARKLNEPVSAIRKPR